MIIIIKIRYNYDYNYYNRMYNKVSNHDWFSVTQKVAILWVSNYRYPVTTSNISYTCFNGSFLTFATEFQTYGKLTK